MAIKYKGQLVNLQNYMQVFDGESVDILDEIRSAIIDDTQIGSLIKYCRDDDYKLKQLRLAIREFLPKKYINPRISGTCIKLLRKYYASGGNLAVFDRYISDTNKVLLSDAVFKRVIECTLNGADIRKVDFGLVSESNVNIICDGLEKGYPVWLLVQRNKQFTDDILRLLITAMYYQVDVHPFLTGDWDKAQITTILNSVNAVDVNFLMENITDKFSSYCISAIIDAMVAKVDFTILCQKDASGHPIYNNYQMTALVNCLKNDWITEEVLNPDLSDMDMMALLEKHLSKSNTKKLNGVIKNK